jgi:hypothetical protein
MEKFSKMKYASEQNRPWGVIVIRPAGRGANKNKDLWSSWLSVVKKHLRPSVPRHAGSAVNKIFFTPSVKSLDYGIENANSGFFSSSPRRVV